MNRRHFLASSAALAAASVFPAPALIAGSPNEEVRVCVLGNGNKGREHSSIMNRLAAAGEQECGLLDTPAGSGIRSGIHRI